MTGHKFQAEGMLDGGDSSWDKSYMESTRKTSGTSGYIGYRLTNYLYSLILNFY